MASAFVHTSRVLFITLYQSFLTRIDTCTDGHKQDEEMAMLLQGTEATQELLLRPGSRRAIVSPYGKATSRAAAYTALSAQPFRQRALTIAHEPTDVTDDAVTQTSVATDALFGIEAPSQAQQHQQQQEQTKHQQQQPPQPPPRLMRRAPTVQPIVTPTTPRGTTTAPPQPMSPVSPVQPQSPQQQQPPQQPQQQQPQATHGWVVGSAGGGAGTGDGIRMASQRNGCVYDEEGKLRYATLEALVERITAERYADASFNRDFVTTCNLFTDAPTLLGLLTARYRQRGAPEGTRLRVLIFLTTWVGTLWSAATTPPPLVAALRAFLAETAADADEGALRGARDKLSRTLQRVLASDDGQRNGSSNNGSNGSNSGSTSSGNGNCAVTGPPPLIPLKMALGAPQPEHIDVFAVHPKELARQLTLVEHELFRAVRPWELQDLAFSKKDKSRAPHVAAVTRHFNAASQWFACAILAQRGLRARVRAAARVLDVAEHCRRLQNYNGVNEIISALNSSAVYRLRRTWAALAPRHTRLFRELSELMANTRNYQNLRHQLHNVEPPLVPYLGVYLTDLTFLEEGNPTMRGTFVNWHKCRLQARIIVEVQTYQQTPYALQPVPWLRDFFLNLEAPLNPDQQWAASIEIEPREAAASSGGSSADNSSSSAAATTTPATPATSLASPRSTAIPLPNTSSEEQAILFGSPLSTSPVSIPSIPGFSAPQAQQQQQQQQQSSATSAAATATSTEEKIRMEVYPPGSSLPVTVEMGAEQLVSDAVQCVLEAASRAGLATDVCTSAEGAGLVPPPTLVVTGTRSFPLGVQLQGALRLADAPDQVCKGGGALLALFRALAVTDVRLADGADAAAALQTSLDAAAPLYTDALVAASLFRRADELCLMMEDGAHRLWWLNANDALAAQGFDETRCRLVLYPLQRLLARPAAEERERARTGRSTLQTLLSEGAGASSSNTGAGESETRCGYLSKLSTKALLRPGVFYRPPPALTGALGSSSSGSMSVSSSSLTRSMLNRGARSGSVSGSTAASTLGILNANGEAGIGGGGLAATGLTASAASQLEKDKKLFVAVDNFLLCYSDAHAAAPREAWALDQCHVSLGTLATGGLCVVVRPHRMAAAGGRRARRRAAVLAGASEADTREWCALLQRKSRYNAHARVFSRSLDEVLLRPGSRAPASFVPAFVRAALERLHARALSDPALFSAPVPLAVAERLRERVDHGAFDCYNGDEDNDSGDKYNDDDSDSDSDSDSDDDEDSKYENAALAQAVLSFYAEMPESLIPGTLFGHLWAYFRAAPEAGGCGGGSACGGNPEDMAALHAIVAALPVANRVNLRYLLTFCARWGAEAGCAERVPALLAPYLVRVRAADAPHPALPLPVADVAARALEGLLRALPRLDLASDAALPARLAALRASAPPSRVPRTPVTVLDRDAAAQLRASLDGGAVGAPEVPAPSHRHFGSSSSSSYASLPLASGGGGEAESGARTNSSGSGALESGAGAGAGAGGDEGYDEEGYDEEGDEGDDEARRPVSTRDKASSIFRRLRESLAPRRRGTHAAHTSLPASTTTTTNTSSGSGSGSGSACSTPTSIAPPPHPPPAASGVEDESVR